MLPNEVLMRDYYLDTHSIYILAITQIKEVLDSHNTTITNLV